MWLYSRLPRGRESTSIDASKSTATASQIANALGSTVLRVSAKSSSISDCVKHSERTTGHEQRAGPTVPQDVLARLDVEEFDLRISEDRPVSGDLLRAQVHPLEALHLSQTDGQIVNQEAIAGANFTEVLEARKIVEQPGESARACGLDYGNRLQRTAANRNAFFAPIRATGLRRCFPRWSGGSWP